eukprot:146175-Prorocentrum_minimum.AAC.5
MIAGGLCGPQLMCEKAKAQMDLEKEAKELRLAMQRIEAVTDERNRANDEVTKMSTEVSRNTISPNSAVVHRGARVV